MIGPLRVSRSRSCISPFVDPSRPPPGPFRPTFWRSPLRGPWLTSVLGFALLIAIPIVALTGFLSNDAYYPRLGGNSVGRPLGPLDFYLFPFPTHPSWLYALTQGLHVTIGLAAFPILLAKLWSVIPKLFEWPPVRSPAHALERLSLAVAAGRRPVRVRHRDPQHPVRVPVPVLLHHCPLLRRVGVHCGVRLPRRREAADDAQGTRDPTWAGAAAGVAGRHAARAAGADRQRVDPGRAGRGDDVPARAARQRRRWARCCCWCRAPGSRSADRFGASRSSPRAATPAAARTGSRSTGPPRPRRSPPARSVQAGACGWSRAGARLRSPVPSCCRCPSTRTTCRSPASRAGRRRSGGPGCPIRELAKLVGIEGEFTVKARSITQNGVFDSATLASEQTGDERTLLALQVNGTDLSLDHGFPGAGDRSGSSGRPLHEVGRRDDVRAGVADDRALPPAVRRESAASAGVRGHRAGRRRRGRRLV